MQTSSGSSPFFCMSRWVDIYLRQVLDQIPSYVKHSNDIVLTLNVLDELDDDIFGFATDATSMSPNINTEERLIYLTIVIDNLIFKVEPKWLRTEIINAIKFLLRFNVFQFSDTYHRKKRMKQCGVHLHAYGKILTFATMEIVVLIPKIKRILCSLKGV